MSEHYSEKCVIRILTIDDFDDAFSLYKELVGDIPVPEAGDGKKHFASVISHAGTTILGAEINQKIVSIVTLHILPNMTFSGRPYGLIENVVTLKAHQKKGYASVLMQAAAQKAWDENAYKIMLLTGKVLGAKEFYEKLGYTESQKYGMILRRAPARNPT